MDLTRRQHCSYWLVRRAVEFSSFSTWGPNARVAQSHDLGRDLDLTSTTGDLIGSHREKQISPDWAALLEGGQLHAEPQSYQPPRGCVRGECWSNERSHPQVPRRLVPINTRHTLHPTLRIILPLHSDESFPVLGVDLPIVSISLVTISSTTYSFGIIKIFQRIHGKPSLVILFPQDLFQDGLRNTDGLLDLFLPGIPGAASACEEDVSGVFEARPCGF